MDVGIALVAGIIIGWLIEWVIDWQYWRRGVRGFYETETALRKQLAEAQAECQSAGAALQETRQELNTVRAQLQAAKVRESELQRRLNTVQTRTPDSPAAQVPHDDQPSASPAPPQVQPEHDPIPPAPAVDDLTRINGIGPAYAQRLHDAGISAFHQVADAAPEELERIIQPAAWQQVDFADWSKQAGELVALSAVEENEGA